MKTCSKCGAAKDLPEFAPDKRASDGLQSQCRACQRLWRAANAARLKAYDKQKYWANVDARRAKGLAAYHADPINNQMKARAWREANPARVAATTVAWKERNPEKVVAARARHYRGNIPKFLARSAARRSAKTRATPPWFDSDMQWFVEEAYALARQRNAATGIKWHVDHIVPLRNSKVSGLHVPWNLQVIPARENLRKNNKFTDSQPLPVLPAKQEPDRV